LEACVLLALITGCDTGRAGSHEQLLKDQAQLLQEVAEILDPINSPEQAAAAQPLLEKAWDMYQDLEYRIESTRDTIVRKQDTMPIKTEQTIVKVNKKLVLARLRALEKKAPYGPALLRPFAAFRMAMTMEHGIPTEQQLLPPKEDAVDDSEFDAFER